MNEFGKRLINALMVGLVGSAGAASTAPVNVTVLGPVQNVTTSNHIVVSGQVVLLPSQLSLPVGTFVRATGQINELGQLVASSVVAVPAHERAALTAASDRGQLLFPLQETVGTNSNSGVTGSTTAGVTGSTIAGVTGSTTAGVTGSTGY